MTAFLIVYDGGIAVLAVLAVRALINLHRTRTENDLARMLAPLPAARESLLPENWPQPQRPLDMPARHDTAGLAAYRLRSRVFEPAEDEPIVVELHVSGGRHRLGEAVGTSAQRARWNSPTGQFWAIVDGLGDLNEPCAHCATPEDGEPAHAGCPGCACPCSTVDRVGVAA